MATSGRKHVVAHSWTFMTHSCSAHPEGVDVPCVLPGAGNLGLKSLSLSVVKGWQSQKWGEQSVYPKALLGRLICSCTSVYLFCVCVHIHVRISVCTHHSHGTLVEGRGQFVGIGFLFPPCGSQVLKSACQTWWHPPFPRWALWLLALGEEEVNLEENPCWYAHLVMRLIHLSPWNVCQKETDKREGQLRNAVGYSLPFLLWNSFLTLS